MKGMKGNEMHFGVPMADNGRNNQYKEQIQLTKTVQSLLILCNQRRVGEITLNFVPTSQCEKDMP